MYSYGVDGSEELHEVLVEIYIENPSIIETAYLQLTNSERDIVSEYLQMIEEIEPKMFGDTKKAFKAQQRIKDFLLKLQLERK